MRERTKDRLWFWGGVCCWVFLFPLMISLWLVVRTPPAQRAIYRKLGRDRLKSVCSSMRHRFRGRWMRKDGEGNLVSTRNPYGSEATEERVLVFEECYDLLLNTMRPVDACQMAYEMAMSRRDPDGGGLSLVKEQDD